jgi:hypothetical protein
MNIKDLNKKKVPIVRIDEALNKYDDVVLFPDKLEKANEMLRKIGLPDNRPKKGKANP